VLIHSQPLRAAGWMVRFNVARTTKLWELTRQFEPSGQRNLDGLPLCSAAAAPSKRGPELCSNNSSVLICSPTRDAFRGLKPCCATKIATISNTSVIIIFFIFNVFGLEVGCVSPNWRPLTERQLNEPHRRAFLVASTGLHQCDLKNAEVSARQHFVSGIHAD
jgi:hypothetical protein